MATLPEQRTKPKQLFSEEFVKKFGKPDPKYLIAGKYGSDDMVRIWGAEKTMGGVLYVQAVSAYVLGYLYPDVVPPAEAKVLTDTANLSCVSPARIREIEEKGGHDVVAINTAWEEEVKKISQHAAAYINLIKTSADSTESAKALQMQEGLEVLADSVENLRDILLEKALEWDDIPFMDVTHLYDAVPTVAGRPFVYNALELQSDLKRIKFFHDESIMGKWADATGNYHSAVDMGLDGPMIEDYFCELLGIRHMDAPAQVPSRKYVGDVYYAISQVAKSTGSLGHFVRWGRSSDVGVFKFPANLGKKGSSAMPHKDMMGGNPDKEEQSESMDRVLTGVLAAGMTACSMDYARDLTGSALDRINLDVGFKCTDHAVRSMAGVMEKLMINPERSKERVLRTYGIVTSPRFLAYLTDRRNGEPMARSDAHNKLGILATKAYQEKKMFAEVLKADPVISAKIPAARIDELADPLTYLGESKSIVHKVYDALHGKRTF